jgi:hypothetical protein
MKEIEDHNDGNLFPVRHKHNPAALTQEEVASILQVADSNDLSEKETLKLLLRLRARKIAAYAKKRK